MSIYSNSIWSLREFQRSVNAFDLGPLLTYPCGGELEPQSNFLAVKICEVLSHSPPVVLVIASLHIFNLFRKLEKTQKMAL